MGRFHNFFASYTLAPNFCTSKNTWAAIYHNANLCESSSLFATDIFLSKMYMTYSTLLYINNFSELHVILTSLYNIIFHVT